MTAFTFSTAGTIRFGRGTAGTASATLAGFGRRVLLVHGQDPARAAWLRADLEVEGLDVAALASVGEPEIDRLEAALKDARAVGPEAVVALGGGSVIDMAKALSALIPAQHPALRYLEAVGDGRPLHAAPLPLVALPTTAGTGAEVTKNAVIGVPAHRRKVSLRDDRMIPKVAIVDPALTDDSPRPVTFASGLDAVTQVIEPYLSTQAAPFTDALCRDAIPRGLAALVTLSRGEDRAARDDMALTSLTGGIALANARLGAVHGLAGVIGGRTRAPHGEICATLLPDVLAENARGIAPDSASAQKIRELRGWIGEALSLSMEDTFDGLGDWIRQQGIRPLGDLGLQPGDVEEIAELARTASSSRTNPVAPDAFDFAAVLRAGLAR